MPTRVLHAVELPGLVTDGEGVARVKREFVLSIVGAHNNQNVGGLSAGAFIRIGHCNAADIDIRLQAMPKNYLMRYQNYSNEV